MKRTPFSIIVFSIVFSAIYLTSCLTLSPTFEEKAVSAGITIIRDSDEKKPIMRELLSKCSPVGKIEQLSAEEEGENIINKALDLGANVVHIYYTDNYSEEKTDFIYGGTVHYVTRFWKCKQPIGEERKKYKPW